MTNIIIDNIIIPDWHPARPADNALVESVKLHGVLEPVAVAPDGPDRYRLLFGHRRLDAARKAGLSAIPATIRDDLDDVSERLLFLVENLARQSLSVFEEGDRLRELVALGLGVVELAKRLARPPSFVRRRLTCATIPPRTRAALDGIPVTASALVLLAALPPNRQLALVEERPDLLRSAEALHEHLVANNPDLAAAAFDTAGCSSCKTRLQTPPVCLDTDCFGDKLSSHVGRTVATARTGDFQHAPLVVTADSAAAAPEPHRDIIRRHRAAVLRDERPAGPGDDLSGSRPALLLDPSGTIRPVRLVPAPHATDGRASAKPHTAEEQAQRTAQLRAAATLRAVSRRLDDALSDPESIRVSDLADFALHLASALAGRDIADPSDAAAVLLDAAAPRLRPRLADRPVSAIVPDIARTDARRVLALLSADPDKELADLDAHADD